MYLFLLILLLYSSQFYDTIYLGGIMTNILLIKSKSNKVKNVMKFQSVELAEEWFKEQSYKINKKLNKNLIEDSLDDGVFESKNTSICLTHNLDNIDNPNYVIVVLVDNIHEESFLYENDHKAKDAFIDLIKYYDSNYPVNK